MTAKKASTTKNNPQVFLCRHAFIAALIRSAKELGRRRSNTGFTNARIAQTPHTEVAGILFFGVKGDVWSHPFSEPQGNWDVYHIEGIIELMNELIELRLAGGETTTS